MYIRYKLRYDNIACIFCLCFLVWHLRKFLCNIVTTVIQRAHVAMLNLRNAHVALLNFGGLGPCRRPVAAGIAAEAARGRCAVGLFKHGGPHLFVQLQRRAHTYSGLTVQDSVCQHLFVLIRRSGGKEEEKGERRG